MNKNLVLYALLVCSFLQGMENIKNAEILVKDLFKIIIEKRTIGEQAAHETPLSEIPNPHWDKKATVSPDVVHENEKQFLVARDPLIKAALEKITQQTITAETKKPTIACAFSGGGYRAMLATVGSLKGLATEEILDCITYNVGLSGSTWALASWITLRMSLPHLSKYIVKKVATGLTDISDEEHHLLAQIIATMEQNKQPYSLVHVYGLLLTSRLLADLKEKRHLKTLSDQQEIIATGALPYPIYTSLNGDDKDRSWYTLTPDSVANIEHSFSIPIYGFGREYQKGESINNSPEILLSTILGTCGAAFAADWKTIFEVVEDYEKDSRIALSFLHIIEKWIEKSGSERPLPFQLTVPNPTYDTDHPFAATETLELVDAGIDINLPLPPLMIPERHADIILVFDNSAGNMGDQLIKCKQYAKMHNVPFPKIPVKDFTKETFHVFEGKNKQTPTVIYFPGISDKELWQRHKHDPRYSSYELDNFDLYYEANSGYCATQRFQYSTTHAWEVINTTEFNVRVNQERIKRVISDKLQQLNQR